MKIYLFSLLYFSFLGATEYTGSSFSLTAKQVTNGILTITDTGTITDIDVKVSGNHYNDISNLDIKIISPYGTAVDLVTSWSGYSFDGTVFDDEATSALSGSAPYFGHFQPVGSLANFDQEEMKGEWTLYVYNSGVNVGSVMSIVKVRV